MKIMMVAPHLNLGHGGGSEKQIIALANGLEREGCEITILLTDSKGDLIPLLSDGIEVIFRDRSANFFSKLAQIHKVAKRKKPDIIYARLWGVKPAAIICGKMLGIKTVVVEDNNLMKKMSGRSAVWKAAAGMFKSSFYKTADRVITISEEGRKDMHKTLGVESTTVHNGIDTELTRDFSLQQAQHRWFEEDAPIAVAVGRLIAQKGFENLVEAVAMVNRTTPLRLLLIGGGPLRDKIARKAECLGISDKVDFTGAVFNPHKYMAKCDVFVCSSLFEGFGLVLAEALAIGMPVVSTDYSYGANEIIEDGKSGILVPVGNVCAMAEAIERVLKDEKLRKGITENAKHRAEFFSVEKMTREKLRIFKLTAETRQ